jgi:hypothetical protein
MQHYFECFQIGAVTLITLAIIIIASGLLLVKIVDNFKLVLKMLGILIGVVSAVAIAEAVGMAMKAIFKI